MGSKEKKRGNKVSIIIPAWNVETEIHRAIESAISQTYPNIEILIVDDGSIDSTWKIIQKYARENPNIKPIHQQNQGVSVARNSGIKAATGEYLLFLDSDDWLEKNAVEVLVRERWKYLENNVLISGCFYSVERLNDKFIKTDITNYNVPNKLSREDTIYNVTESVYALCSACYKLFDSKIIHENNLLFNREIYNGEDGLFVFQYIQHIHSFKYVAMPLWNIYERKGSFTRAGYSHKKLTCLQAVRKMLECDDLSSRNIIALKDYYISRLMSCLVDAIMNDKNELYKTDIKFMKNELRKRREWFDIDNKKFTTRILWEILKKYPNYIVKLFVYANKTKKYLRKR